MKVQQFKTLDNFFFFAVKMNLCLANLTATYGFMKKENADFILEINKELEELINKTEQDMDGMTFKMKDVTVKCKNLKDKIVFYLVELESPDDDFSKIADLLTETMEALTVFANNKVNKFVNVP